MDFLTYVAQVRNLQAKYLNKGTVFVSARVVSNADDSRDIEYWLSHCTPNACDYQEKDKSPDASVARFRDYCESLASRTLHADTQIANMGELPEIKE